MNNLLWHVLLSDAHPQYQQTSRFRRSGHLDYEIAIVDAQKLIQYSAKDVRTGYVTRRLD